MRLSTIGGSLLLLAGMATGCTGGKRGASSAPPETPPELTYHGNVKPLLDARCTPCHTTGDIAFPLQTFADVHARRDAVVSAVETRRMPVWLAAPGHEEFKDNPVLTDAEIQVFRKWAEGGFAEGDATDSPVTPPGASLRDLEAHVVLPIIEGGGTYLPAQDRADDYRCFVVALPFADQARYVTGFQAIPGKTEVVHHLVSYVASKEIAPWLRRLDDEEDGLGYQCYGGAIPDRLGNPAVQAQLEKESPGIVQKLEDETYWLSHWAPGMRGNQFPVDTGIPVPAGSVLVVQVHYYSRTAPGVSDQGTEIRLRTADHVAKPAFVYPLSNDKWFAGKRLGSMVIPAGGTTEFTWDRGLDEMAEEARQVLGIAGPVKGIEVHTANLHMHSYGKSAVTWLETEGGQRDVMLEIPRWNLNWQRDFTFVTPKTFTPEEAKKVRMHLTCTFDNRTEKTVYGGLGSDDEMCMNFPYLVLEL